MDTRTIELKDNWRFHLGECEEAWYKGYDDSSWRKVMVPHDWSVEAPFSKTYSSGTGYLQGGTGWYRVRFHLPEEYRGKRVRLVFDGVYKNSQVFCNSYYLGKRPNGYISFSYDISGFVVFGEAENEISVKVVHEDLADSRWFTGSGITRKVTLIIEEPVHPVEYGCTFRTNGISGEGEKMAAQVEAVHEPVNTGSVSAGLSVRTVLLSDEGHIAAELTGALSLAPGERGKLVLKGDVESSRLWSPDAPYLYRMQTTYRVNGGEEYLVHEEKVGIRTIDFSPEKGFFLNGVNRKIKGVCVHHDGGCLGAAMRPEVWQRRLKSLKDCGCNAIRCSHNPHMPELYALCDAMGFLVMDEAFDEWENPKNKWSTGHNVYPPKHQGYYEAFPEWHEKDLRAMVRRDRNHPSVILWSIGNEIDYPNDPYCHPMFETMTGNNDANKPAAERQYDVNKPNMERIAVIAGQLAAIVKEEDGSRPVTVAAAFPELSSKLGFFDMLSVVGYNYKEHLYEKDHKRFPDKTFLGSENGHSEEAWKAVTDNPYICGQFLWTGIDYLGEAKGWPVHGSPAGLLTTAGFPKPEYNRRKALWLENAPGEEASQSVGTEAETADGFDNCTGKAVGLSAALWKEKDALSGQAWEYNAGKTGYLYQILVNLTDKEGRKVTVDDKEVMVQVQGDGVLAGIDNGDLADVTPFSSDSRKTYRGDMAVYVRRTGTGDIRVFLRMPDSGKAGECIEVAIGGECEK
ncbi:MAG: glycoside hydrolase family 2 [Lachnospiraceae bacterium]|nr:glycoside hydrolase family 2 [Lachnospiraceae bacterium]